MSSPHGAAKLRINIPATHPPHPNPASVPASGVRRIHAAEGHPASGLRRIVRRYGFLFLFRGGFAGQLVALGRASVARRRRPVPGGRSAPPANGSTNLPFNAGSGLDPGQPHANIPDHCVASSAVLIAWKRIYYEQDEMYRQGTLLRVRADGGDTRLLVQHGSDFVAASPRNPIRVHIFDANNRRAGPGKRRAASPPCSGGALGACCRDPGQSVILSAEVSVVSPGGGTPQGTVIFRDANPP